MKTTVNLPPSLLSKAKRHALEHGLTLKEVIERGIQLVLAKREVSKGFKLKDFSVSGNGLQPGMSFSDWDSIRKKIYKGRGE